MNVEKVETEVIFMSNKSGNLKQTRQNITSQPSQKVITPSLSFHPQIAREQIEVREKG